MEPGSPAVRRCAIYTRKSSEEGLEQDFNSLQAQREACESYVASQCSEGWRPIETHYDDGGLSGGTMERPALQRLLVDIKNRLIDVVVVYKVDRLTRSLADFAKMVEVFDAQGVSFVSITQQFNTTTSMGRLTLNVLLSFAQFEREVTGERIRDKIAASKKKGMWMGGFVPVGYRKQDRSLVADDTDAEMVRLIFKRYNELKSVCLLKQDLDERGFISKIRLGRNGLQMGGKPFSRGKLYKMLSNPIYVGEIRHKKTCHPGQHQPLVERELWDRTQRLLREQAIKRKLKATKVDPSPLAGKLFDHAGECLTPTHATGRGRRRYRYYVSRLLLNGGSTSTLERGWRVAAHEIESKVAAAAADLLNDKAIILKAIEDAGIEIHRIEPILEDAQAWAGKLRLESELANALATLVQRVQLQPNGIELSLGLPVLQAGKNGASEVTLSLNRFLPMKIKRRGVEARLIIGKETASKVDLVLLRSVVRGHRWFDELASGKVPSMAVIAKREQVNYRFVGKLMRLAFLAPDIVEAIAEGRQPPNLTAEMLTKHIRLPLDWNEQVRVLGFE